MNNLLLFAQNTPDATGAAAGIFGGAVILMVFLWVLGIAATVFWVWMLIDALTNEPTTEQKILWFLVIFFLHIIGALVYLFVRKEGGARTRAVG
jgi:hypothetical protein